MEWRQPLRKVNLGWRRYRVGMGLAAGSAAGEPLLQCRLLVESLEPRSGDGSEEGASTQEALLRKYLSFQGLVKGM